MILDRSRNKEHQDLQLLTNLTRVLVLYITLPEVQNEDSVKIVLKSLEITRKRLEHNSRSKQKQGATRFAFMNKFDQGLRFVHNPTKSTKRRPRQNRLEITRKWLQTVFCTRSLKVNSARRTHCITLSAVLILTESVHSN